MPSKIQLDENLWFLFVCLQKSDYKAIDFNAVGHETNLKPPAARMRYTRLKRQIESGTLIGTHGTPFAGGAEKIAEAMRKRKRGGVKKGSEESDDGGKRERSEGTLKEERVPKIKNENEVSYVSTDEDSGDEFEEEDSEDDKPIVKRRGKKGTGFSGGGGGRGDWDRGVGSMRDVDPGMGTERFLASVREYDYVGNTRIGDLGAGRGSG